MRKNKVHNVSQFGPNKLEIYSLHHLIKNTILVAQFFAILPVHGITKETNDLQFKWASFRTAYTISAIAVQIFLAVVVLVHSILNLENFLSFVGVVWCVRSLLGLVIFLRLARQWPSLLRKWSEMELDMLSYGPSRSMKLRFKLMPVLFLFLGASEHLMYTYGSIRIIAPNKNKIEDVVEEFFVTNNAGVFDYFQYNYGLVVLIEVLGLISTFSWQFCDLLIVLLSSAMAEKFRQINTKINSKQILNESQWRDVRKQYNRLALLCKTLNSSLSDAILLSFFGNTYFLSMAVFQCLSPRTTYEALFFLVSLIFNLFHVLIVCFYGAWVQEESWASISEISSLPVRHISHEVDRVLHQMAARDIAITGAGLFKVSRSLILNIGGVVVTLQLIFVQFNARFSSKLA